MKESPPEPVRDAAQAASVPPEASATDLHAVGVYKAAAPEDTIARIRQLLKDSGIFVIERHWRIVPGHWASVQLRIPGTGFHVNGKGIDLPFALASGYAELVERLQFLNDLRIDYPDRRLWSANETLRAGFVAPAVNQANLGAQARNEDGGAVVPFYHVNTGQVRELPIEALRLNALTNGTCSGNRPHEALIHGLCEILERHLLRRIFAERPVLPTIPLDDLRSLPQFATLAYLEQQGFGVIVKDCSFNGAWPVVGVILRRGEGGLFHLGASPSFPLALERCLTEIFQGLTIEQVAARLRPIPATNADTDPSPFESSLRFVRSARNIERLVEPSLLATAGDYDARYVHHSAPDMVSAATARALAQRVIAAGHDLYVRDIGFLGFPSYTLYIPGMSLLQDAVYHHHAQTNDRAALAAIYLGIDHASPGDLRRLAEAIRVWTQSPVKYSWESLQQGLLGLPHGPDLPWTGLDPILISALLFEEAGDSEAAAAVLARALASVVAIAEIEAPPADLVAARVRFGAYLAFRRRGVLPTEAIDRAFAANADPVSRRLRLRLEGRIGRSAFLQVPPNCYHCATCALAPRCAVPGRTQLEQGLQARMQAYVFDQRRLETLFAEIPQ